MNRFWVGQAGDEVDIWELDVSSGVWGPGDIIELGIASKTLAVTLGTMTEDSQVALAVATAFTASGRLDGTGSVDATSNAGGWQYPEFQELNAVAVGSIVRFTGTLPGRPVYLNYAYESMTTGMATLANVQPATGRSHWDNGLNWAPEGVPADGDALFFESGTTSILYGLPTVGSAGHLQCNITTQASWTGSIGLFPINAMGNPYPEYRQRHVILGDGDSDNPSIWTFGLGAGAGSPLLNLAYFGADAGLTVRCHKTASPTGTSHALNLAMYRGTRVSVLNGSVNVSPQFGLDHVELDALDVAGGSVQYGGNSSGGSFDATVTNGTVYAYGQQGTDGESWTIGASAVVTYVDYSADTTLVIEDGGKAVWNGSLGITSLDVQSGGVFDAEKDNRAFTVDECRLWAKGSVLDGSGRATWSSGIALQACDVDDVTLRVGNGRTVTVA